METITMLAFLEKVNKSEFRRRLIPMELSSGWPSVSIKNAQICITVPFFRMQPGSEGKIALFPLSCLFTLTWPHAMVVEFASLRYRKEYKNIDFAKPVGIFKHEAVKDLPKDEYIAKRNELFALYDQLLDSITNRKAFEKEEEMRGLFRIMMEPSLYPMYKHIAQKFFETYCGL